MLLAALLAPPAPCLAYALVYGLLMGHARFALAVFTIALVVSELVTFAVGLPAFLLLKRAGHVGQAECIVSGGLVGVTFALTLAFANQDPELDIGSVIGIFSWATLGAAIGYTFWVLALREPIQ